MLLLPPHLKIQLSASTLFPSSTTHHLSLPLFRHRLLIFRPPLSPTINAASTDTQYGITTINNRRYDFAPLLTYLSDSDSDSGSDIQDSIAPTSLAPEEFELAETYRAVPLPLWHSILKSLSSNESTIPLAYDLVCWLQKHNLCFSYELLYSILIHALGKSDKLYEAFLLSQKQPSLTPLTYNALISACARSGDIGKALNLMSRMRQDGYPSDFVNYSLVIRTLMRDNKVDCGVLDRLYAEIECDRIELEAQLWNDIIVGFAKAGDLTRALEFLGMLQSAGLSARSATFVSVILGLGILGRVLEAEAVFEEMKDGGLKPGVKAYNALLKGYVKGGGSLEDVDRVVTDMEKNGVSLDETSYGLLIDAYANAGSWESARSVLKDMEANNVKPNAYVFSRILASYRDKGEWQKSFDILKEMKSSGIRPDRHFYNVMIDTLGKYNSLDIAVATFERMLSEGIQPDTVTWNTLIDCHAKLGHRIRAEELFEEMQQKGFSPCLTTYNIMINCLGKQERWEDVTRLLRRMNNEKILPNVVTYTTLVDVYGQSGRFDDAIGCLEDMKSSGLKPPHTMYNALINAYARRGMADQAINVFRVMRADGLKPSLLALNSLINAFSEDRRDADAFAVLEFMKEHDIKPDIVTYTTLMKALIRVDKFHEVPAVYEEMILSGCAPDRKAKAMLRSALKYTKEMLKYD